MSSSSWSESKWSSMARFEAPVTKTRRVAPAESASSTAYWISGLSTTGSISLGLALVAGRKRVPRPATGNTAVRIADLGLVLITRISRALSCRPLLQSNDPDSSKTHAERENYRGSALAPLHMSTAHRLRCAAVDAL